MNIAVASLGLEVSSYFENCTNYNCFTVEEGRISTYRNLPILPFGTPGAAQACAQTLHDLDVDTVIVGCINPQAKLILENEGLVVFSGAIGDAQRAAEAYITNTFIASDESCDEYL
ncbi:MAG: hypothetical protein LBG81_07615 [Coriobacteriaceae bacterium]|jgi:predicted Fe-Mo cluster-binding NifX family protein|nr:hypothetical protein [Coriobacteriaceae bacterium]